MDRLPQRQPVAELHGIEVVVGGEAEDAGAALVGRALVLHHAGVLAGGLAQLTLTGALRLAPVALVMPMDYTSLLWATLLGAWLFAEMPTPWTWVGAPLIIVSGLVIVWREHRLARRAALSVGRSGPD